MIQENNSNQHNQKRSLLNNSNSQLLGDKKSGQFGISNQGIIITLLVVTFVFLGVYNYTQLYERCQINERAINSKIDEMRISFQREHQSLLNLQDNITQSQVGASQYFDSFISQINEKYNNIYSQIQAIMWMAKQSEENEENNQKHLKQLINQQKKVESLQQQMRLFYESSKNFELVLSTVSNARIYEQTNQIIPQKVLWLFLNNTSNNYTYLNSLYYQNIEYFTKESGFELKTVTINNYYYYLSPQKISILYDIFSVLKKSIQATNDESHFKDQFNHIAQILIMMHILEQNGGIIMNGYTALLQPLDWIQKIKDYRFVNKGNGNADPKVIAFFDPQKSSTKRLQIKKDVSMDETLMYRFPSLDELLIFAVKGSELIANINKEMIRILTNPKDIYNQITSQKYQLNRISGKEPYLESFLLANQIVLQKKQREIDSVKRIDTDGYQMEFAIDYFGLYTINRYFGPYKLKIHFEAEPQSLIFNYLSKYSMQELDQKMGKIQFAARVEPHQYFESKITQIKQKNLTEVMRGSFMQQVFYPSPNSQNIQFYQNQRSLMEVAVEADKKWAELPKKIWVYRSKNINDDNKIVESKCLSRIREQASKTGFEVNLVTEKMLNSYLSKQTVEAMNKIWNKSVYKDERIKQVITMLTLLSQEGGVFIDSSYLLLDRVDWVINLPAISPKYFNNRLGELPNIFMFTNPGFQQNFSWKFDTQAKTRIKPDLIYELSFIAATKQNRVIDEWLENLMRIITMKSNSIEEYFHSCQIIDPVYKNDRNYLLPVDVLRCVMKRGIKQISKLEIPFNGEYNLWSMDGDISLWKFNEATNYQNVHKSQNQFLVRYSKGFAEGIVGRLGKVIKLDVKNLNYLNDKIKNYESQKQQIHNQSIFSQYLLL